MKSGRVWSFEVVNEALRKGLKQTEGIVAKPYKMVPLALGLKPGLSYDNIQELLDQIEGEDRR